MSSLQPFVEDRIWLFDYSGRYALTMVLETEVAAVTRNLPFSSRRR